MRVTAAKISQSRAFAYIFYFFFIYFSVAPTWENVAFAQNGCNSWLLSAVGLSIYNDSNSESEEEQSEHTQIQNDDSDEELKVGIFLHGKTLRNF